MKEFKIFVSNKSGELARVTEALASSAVNIREAILFPRDRNRLVP